MGRVEKTVFISYRRTNAPWALAIWQYLTHHGYDVFFDFEGIDSGDFESVILENIRWRAHFVVLLNPSALERCGEPGDWLRREIETALDSRRNIVPLMLEGFDFGSPAMASQLTDKLTVLKHYNALRVPVDYFPAAMDRLRETYLNVALDAVPHPASSFALQAAKEDQAAARLAPEVFMEVLEKEDITERFSLDQVDHQELLKLFELRYKTCWRVAKNQITFPADNDYRLKVNVSHGQIERIFAGKSLSDGELDELLDQVEADLKDDRIAEFGREILFANKPVTGGFRFSSVEMQILPAPARAPRPPQTHADNPFVLEYPIRAYKTPDMRFVRRNRTTVEWARVLNALLNTSIKHSGPRAKQFWASNIHGNLNKCYWAQEFYIFPGFQGFRSGLSRKSKSPLTVVPADAYFGPRNNLISLLAKQNALDNFYLPDNLDQLVAAFLSLNGEKRRRFLRSATMIYLAKELWDTSISSSFLAWVQAIEALSDKPPEDPCPTCGKDRTDGVKKIVEKYGKGMEIDKEVLDDLCGARLSLAHGEYLFQIDESPESFGYVASVASDNEREMIELANTIAKQVLRNWLLSQAA